MILSSLLAIAIAPTSILIQGGTIVDGTGKPGYRADLRIEGTRIIEIKPNLAQRPGEKLLDAKGFVVSPGFIDAHSHASGGIMSEPTAISQLTQGITTAVVGQDGGWSKPIKQAFADYASVKPAINFASFSGHGGIRAAIMGNDYKRPATASEISRMQALVEQDMKDGALGVSSGLEYDPGYYSNTEELIALNKIAAKYQGMYISHMRDEGDSVFKAIAELQEISNKANIPAQISHVKLATFAVWNRANEVNRITANPPFTADVYPYLYWQSTIAALTPSRDWKDRKIWEKGLADVGGPQNVRLSTYIHNPAWAGKTLDVIAKETGKDAISIIQEILEKTQGEGGESVVVTAMTEPDLEAFIRSARTMFCSDGNIGGSHPRGAGAFPRVLARYVRERKTISLEEAIRKMTALTARTFQLKERGELKPNYIADITIFDPKTIQDHATPTDPTKLSTGVKAVIVSGQITMRNGYLTGARNGKMILRGR
ncbi:MAG: D-aminoacylase [Fimbriimonadaceae bacterium]|nr:MAG: D-aminoacylase [Fimbriimonadaceae bacterium]